ncbi:MAG: DUF4860 domain-containing protein [Oscillospiraceae bacterium]|nr:DUF4860 domain-containing protein [Oscillospiraceae bacterium]
MNRPETKRLADIISSAANMTLFLLFAVCCLVMITVAAAAYSRINENYGNTFNSTAAVRYITNKIRASESAEILAENQLLLENTGYSTLIYQQDGIVYERLFPEGDIITAEGGEELFRAEKLLLQNKSGLISVTVTDDDGGRFEALCRKADGGDGNA